MVTGPVRTVLLSLVAPVAAEQLLSTLVGLVDTYLAGNLAEQNVEATSAVGLAAYVGWLVTMLFALVGTGTTALVARAFGADDRDLANRVANQSMTMSVAMGLAGSVAMYMLAPSFATWQNMHGATYRITVDYLRIESFGHTAMALTLVGGAALRGAGDMRTPMKILAAVNVFNVILSVALVYGAGPLPAMGVNGIVTGTLCSRWLGGLMMIAALMRPGIGLVLRRALLVPRLGLIHRILRIGVPAAMDGAVMWTGHFLFLMIVARLAPGESIETNHAYAAQIVVVRLEAFTYLPASAWAAACATMIGQSLGAGLPQRARRSGNEGALQCGLLTAAIGVLFIIFARPICSLMHTDPQVIDLSSRVLVLAAIFQPALALSIVYMGSLRGAGDTTYPLLFTGLSLAIVRLPFGYLLGIELGYGLLGAWIAVCGDMVVRMALASFRFQGGRWASTRV